MDQKIKTEYEKGLKSFSDKIVEIEARVKNASLDVQAKAMEEIARLKIRAEELQNKIKNGTESGIESLKGTYQKTMEDLNRSLDNIKSKF